VISVFIIFSTLLLASFQGFNAPPEVADQIATEVESLAATTTWADIFLNNFLLTLVTFIPIFGVLFAVYVQFNTGYALGALSQVYGVNNVQATLTILVTPVGILEYSAYVLALAESIIIVHSAYKKELKKRLVNHTWKTLIIVASLLLIGAVVEASILGRL
jgi:uncharacterized membrane protein SpoIIM required for sporulation